jgi:Protein of unknown function (DUF1275)
MASSPTTEKFIPYALLGMTAVTRLVDAVSFLSLGRVFTANMTGNIVLLAFATAHVSGLSIARSLTALSAFLVGAVVGGRSWLGRAPIHRFALGHKLSSWSGISVCCVVLRHRIPSRSARRFLSTVCSDRLNGARDGHTECCCPEARNPRSDDNGPDINDYRHRRGLFAREREQPETGEKGCVGGLNVFGCGVRCSPL